VIRGRDGERVVPMEDFHVGPYMTAVGDGEMLTEVRLPLRPGRGSAHEKVERRAGDWAIAAASAAVWIDGGTIADAGIALSAVGPTTIHLTAPRSCCAAAAVRGAVRQAARDRRRGLLADRRRPRPGRLQAPPRRRAHQARAAPRAARAPLHQEA
jgi:CO/xanthine dehydrogenase FAD-binding subunit